MRTWGDAVLYAVRSNSFAPSCSVYQPPYAPRSLEIHCTQLFQSRLIVPRRSRYFVAVSVPAYGREKQWWRCRVLGASASFGGGRSRTTACSCQRRNDATARRCAQVSHVLFPEWVGAAGAYEPSCDLQRAPRCGGAASLPSVRKLCKVGNPLACSPPCAAHVSRAPDLPVHWLAWWQPPLL